MRSQGCEIRRLALWWHAADVFDSSDPQDAYPSCHCITSHKHVNPHLVWWPQLRLLTSFRSSLPYYIHPSPFPQADPANTQIEHLRRKIQSLPWLPSICLAGLSVTLTTRPMLFLPSFRHSPPPPEQFTLVSFPNWWLVCRITGNLLLPLWLASDFLEEYFL